MKKGNPDLSHRAVAEKASRKVECVPKIDGFIEKIRKLIETILDPDVPLWMKGLAAAALAYFLLVPDLIPDFFGIPGYLDDAAVVCAAVANLGAALRRHNSAKHPKERRKP